ncbi:ABC transporter permease [Candidatus Poribacteria bacterium]
MVLDTGCSMLDSEQASSIQYLIHGMLNPLLIKELHMQTRGRETYAVGSIFILALSALAFSLIWESSTGDRTLDAEYGKGMFLAFVIVLMLGISLICPAFTVGAISSERERLTFNQLRVTLLRPHQILVGKAIPPLIYILILLFASLPIAVLIVPLGGISPSQMAYCYLIAFISALAFSLIGLMCSSIYNSTRASTVMAYAIIGLFTFGTAVLPLILTGVFRVSGNRALLDLFIALNPFRAAFSIFGKGKQFQLIGLPSWGIAIVGYLIISVMASCIALLRFKKMRS